MAGAMVSIEINVNKVFWLLLPHGIGKGLFPRMPASRRGSVICAVGYTVRTQSHFSATLTSVL